MKRRLNLQLFAEDGAANSSATEPAQNSAGNDNQGKAQEGSAAAEAKYTDADVNKILDRKFAEWQKKQQKAVDEAQKLATMSATQKAEYERDQLKKELDDLRRASARSEMSKTARKMLSDKGINVSDDLLSMMIADDAEHTKNAVDGFSKMFAEALEAAVKERLKGEPPRRGSGGSATMTKEQIMAIRDPELRQRKMIENKELFNF